MRNRNSRRHQGQGHRNPGRARVPDIVDASVVEGALRRGDLIISSDEDDLTAIAAAVGRRVDIDHP
jgi:hypothetical protein